MTDIYDLTNPITDALGDQHTLREVTMINHSSITRIEPLTNTSLPPGQTVLVRVIGDIGHEQLINQLQQINELKGFEVIGVTSVPVEDEGGGYNGFIELINCVENNHILNYTNGLIFDSYFGYSALINPLSYKVQITIPEVGQEISLYGSIDGNWLNNVTNNIGLFINVSGSGSVQIQQDGVPSMASMIPIENGNPPASGQVIEIDMIARTVKNITTNAFARNPDESIAQYSEPTTWSGIPPYLQVVLGKPDVDQIYPMAVKPMPPLPED